MIDISQTDFKPREALLNESNSIIK